MSDWLPIESAPNGEWVLVCGGEPNGNWWDNLSPMVVAIRSYADECWNFAFYDGGYLGEYHGPTHWKPLPAPPSV